jgi:hypothetical protein
MIAWLVQGLYQESRPSRKTAVDLPDGRVELARVAHRFRSNGDRECLAQEQQTALFALAEAARRTLRRSLAADLPLAQQRRGPIGLPIETLAPTLVIYFRPAT